MTGFKLNPDFIKNVYDQRSIDAFSLEPQVDDVFEEGMQNEVGVGWFFKIASARLDTVIESDSTCSSERT